MSDQSMLRAFEAHITESARVKQSMLALTPVLLDITKSLLQVVQRGGCIYSCGNGGSACDSMHFTEELVARYHRERPGVRAHHFHDPGTLTCWCNDYDYASVFERQAQTFITDKDALIVFTTSGNSENLLRALAVANKAGAVTIGLLGKGGGKAKALVQKALIVESNATAHIQEAHIAVVHMICDQLEVELFHLES